MHEAHGLVRGQLDRVGLRVFLAVDVPRIRRHGAAKRQFDFLRLFHRVGAATAISSARVCNSRLPQTTGPVGSSPGVPSGVQQHRFDFVAVEGDGADPRRFIGRGFQQHVVTFARAQEQRIDFDRLHRRTVGGDHCQRMSVDLKPELISAGAADRAASRRSRRLDVDGWQLAGVLASPKRPWPLIRPD